jgi:hypothetical protein
MAWPDDQHTLDCVREALDASRVREPFPEIIGLPHLISELRSWLEDDRQWRHARASGWRSLIQDTRASLEPYSAAALLPTADHSELLDELDQCDREIAQDDPHREELLRRRLASICDQLESALLTGDARAAVWEDIVGSASDPAQAQAATRRLLDLAAWAGLDTEVLLRTLQADLAEGDQRPILGPHHRLKRAGEEVTREPRRATITVWLRILFAHLRTDKIAVGPHVTVFQADLLLPQFGNPNRDTPLDLVNDDGPLEALCRADQLRIDRSPTMAKHVETPWALARIDVPDATTDEAVRRARLTAATFGALGTLYGAAPSLWRVDDSYVTFRGARRSAATSSAPVAESATFAERTGVGRDPTAGLLRFNADRLGRHLPTTSGRMAEIAQLMLWLRDARSSPPAARLVLCDRAIETISGWAGVATPRRFVERHLIPSWSRRQMIGELRAVAIDLYYNDERQHLPDTHPDYQAWASIVTDQALRLRDIAEGDAPALTSLIINVGTLPARIPARHPNQKQVQQIARFMSSPTRALRWFETLVEQGLASEARRSRTRNALVHGGPLSEPTVDIVLPFAQYMADEALGRTLDAFLNGEDACTAFMRLAQRGNELRRRLKAKHPVADVLTWD